MMATPPLNLLEQVTPVSQWRQKPSSRIFINETLFGSPQPVVNSTRCDDPNLKGGVPGPSPSHEASSGPQDESSNQTLNVFDMTDTSLFLNPQHKAAQKPSVDKQKIAEPAAEVSTRAKLVNLSSPVLSSPSQSEVFASTNRQTIRQTVISTNEPKKSEFSPTSRRGSAGDSKLSKIPLPRRLSGTFSKTLDHSNLASTSTPPVADKSKSSCNQTYEIKTRSDINSETFTSPVQAGTDVNLAEYLCPVEDPPEDTLAQSVGSADDSSFNIGRDVSAQHMLNELKCKSVSNLSKDRSFPASSKSSDTYSVEKTHLQSTNDSASGTLIQDSSAKPIENNQSANLTKGSLQESSVNLMNFDSPHYPILKPTHETVSSASHVAGDVVSAAQGKGEMSKLLSLSSSIASSLTAEDYKKKMDFTPTCSPSVQDPKLMQPYENNCITLQPTAHQNSRQKSLSETANTSAHLNISNNCSLPHTSTSKCGHPSILGLQEAVQNTTLSKSLTNEADEVATIEVARPIVSTSRGDVADVLLTAEEHLGLTVNQSTTAKHSGINLSAEVMEEKSHEDSHVEIPSATVIKPPKVPTENQNANLKTSVHMLSAEKPMEKENMRPVSPILLPVTEDEMDSRSESNWSVYSELSESCKPLYSKSLLDTLMSGDGKAMLAALAAKSSVTSAGGHAKSISTVLSANMELLNEVATANKPESYHSTSSSVSSESSTRVRISETHTEISKEKSKSSISTATKSHDDRPSADSFFDVDTTLTSHRKLPEDRLFNRSPKEEDTNEAEENTLVYDSAMFAGSDVSSMMQSSISAQHYSLSASAPYPDVLKSFIKRKLADQVSGIDSQSENTSSVCEELEIEPVVEDYQTETTECSSEAAKEDSAEHAVDAEPKAVTPTPAKDIIQPTITIDLTSPDNNPNISENRSPQCSHRSNTSLMKNTPSKSLSGILIRSPGNTTVTDDKTPHKELSSLNKSEDNVNHSSSKHGILPKRKTKSLSPVVSTDHTDVTVNHEFSQHLIDPVTPGHPTCESSHIHRADSPSDRSTQYMSLAAPSALRHQSNIDLSPLSKALADAERRAGRLSPHHQTIEEESRNCSSRPKLSQVEDWLSTQCYEYVSGAEAATVHLCNDTTLRQNQTVHKSPVNITTASTKIHAEHQSPNKTSASMIEIQPSFNNTTAFHTIMHSEDTTLHALAEESKMAAHSLSSAISPPSSTISASKPQIELPSSFVLPEIHCIMTNINAEVPIKNLTDRWLNVSMEITEHRLNGKLSSTKLFFRQGDNIVKPSVTDYLPIWLNSAVAGRHEITLAITVKGKENSKPMCTILAVIIEAPSIQLVDNSDGILDFGVVPYGCVRKVPLTLTNKSSVAAALVVKIIQDANSRGSMEFVTGPLMSAVPTKDPLCMKLTLTGYRSVSDDNHTQSVYIVYKAPLRHCKMGSPENVTGRIVVYLASAVVGDPLVSAQTKALCGYSNLQFPAKFHSFEMRCKPNSEVVEDIPIRNSGDVPLDVTLALSDKNHFILTPYSLHIKPGEFKTCRLTFLSKTMSSIDTTALCTLAATIEPEGKTFKIETRGSVEPPSAIPAHISQLRSNALKLNAPNTEKTKLKMTPSIIKFGGVDLSEKRAVTVKFQNWYEVPVKLCMDIDKSEYQIAIDMDGQDKFFSAKEIILPVSQSKDDFYPIRIVYQPRKVGFVKSRLKCSCPEINIRFRAPIYGYGGPSLVQPVIDSQPNTGEYVLYAGPVQSKNVYNHQFFLRNVGFYKGFLMTKCYSNAYLNEELEPSRISVLPSPAVVSPADAMRVTVSMKITERERVLCEKKRSVIATIRIIYVDQILRQLLQRLAAKDPSLKDSSIAPFLLPHQDDSSELELQLPTEAASVNLFQSHIKSFLIHICADPPRPGPSVSAIASASSTTLKRHAACTTPAAVSATRDRIDHNDYSQPVSQATGLVVAAKVLKFFTQPNETQELTVDLRNRIDSDIEVQVSRPFIPFKCKTRSFTLRAKNRGMLRIQFSSPCSGTWEENLTITCATSTHTVTLIGKCEPVNT